MTKTGKRRKLTKAEIKAAADRAEARAKGKPIDAASEPSGPLNPPEIGRGRPTVYKPEYAAVAKVMCERGATDIDLADAFGVTTRTVERWRSEHDEFCRAVVVGKDIADDLVERSLYQRAVGYSYSSEKLFAFQGNVTRVAMVEHVPPDPGAAMNWLANRRRDRWRISQRHEHSGPGGGPIEVAADPRAQVALARWIAWQLERGLGERPACPGT